MSTSLPTETQVLVVGSGPNGMACAIRLASLGLQVTLVDALPGGKFGARASLIHPRTLEELDTVGLTRSLLDLGIHSTGVTFHSDAQTLLSVDVSKLDQQTQFPTTLLIPQQAVERVFYERLIKEKVEMHRESMVVGMKETDAGVQVTFEGGATVLARYVVGADGARSTIRRLAGIDFRDPMSGVPYDVNEAPATALQIILGDIYLELPLPPKLLLTCVSWHLNGLLLFCPLPQPKPDPNEDVPRTHLIRIAVVVPRGVMGPRHPDAEYLQAELDRRNPWPERLKLVSVIQASTYRLRSAVASTFFKKMGDNGSVLLVGDAAHVHSPTGGQGMNLGLCDAIALGRAIRAHADRVAKGQQDADEVLIRWSQSRKTTAIRVIGFVKKLTGIINIEPGWRRVLRNTLMYIAGSLPFFRRIAAWRLSGLVNRDYSI